MKILESYKKIAKSMLIEHAWDRKFGEPLPTLEDVMKEADDDKYVSIGFGRFKLKGKENDEDAEVFVKTKDGKYASSADQSSDDNGADKEEPKDDDTKDLGKGMNPDDFERDFDDDPTRGDPDDAWDDEEGRAKPFGGDTGVDADFGMDDDWEDDEDAKAAAFADMEDEDEWDESIKIINGKKYREVKEEKTVTERHLLKETYERIGGK